MFKLKGPIFYRTIIAYLTTSELSALVCLRQKRTTRT